MSNGSARLAFVCWIAFAGAAAAQAPALTEPPVVTAPPPAPVVSDTVTIPAGTAVTLEFRDPLSSKSTPVGDFVALRLAEPIVVGGEVVVPMGAAAGGEVLDAAPSRMAGQQGKLIISGRFLELDGQRVRIRGMTIQVAGRSRVDTANTLLLVPYVGIASVLVQGGEIEIPAGTRAQARLAVDAIVRRPPPAPSPALSPSSQP